MTMTYLYIDFLNDLVSKAIDPPPDIGQYQPAERSGPLHVQLVVHDDDGILIGYGDAHGHEV